MASEKFKAWVKAYGVQRLADNLLVHRSTVYSWLKGTTVPSDNHRIWILRFAGRKLKLGDIVDGY